MKICEDDIITLHAPLIHTAADIQFQLKYKNGVLDAEIICLGSGSNDNVQRTLENYFSQVGIPIKGENPAGLRNSTNLTYTVTNEFIPGTEEVFLSGSRLNGDQSDADRDYDIISVGPNMNKGVVLRLDASQAHRLNAPPFQNEGLQISYAKRITFNTKGGT